MADSDPVEMTIAIVAGPVDAVEQDAATRDLLEEILQTDVISAELAAAGRAPPGARGIDVGFAEAIVGGVTSGTVPVLALGVQSWLRRRRDASAVTISLGSVTVELGTEMTAEHTAAVIEALKSAAEN